MHSIDLGGDTFVSSSGDLSLTLRSTIDLLLPPDTHFLKDETSLEDSLRCRDIWIDQSAEVQIYLHVAAEATLSSQVTTFITDIGFRLCDSQMWADLNLASLFKSCNHHAEEFRLHFGLRKHTGPFLPPNLSKMLATMQVLPDCAPPLSIPRVELSTLRISLEYRRPSSAIPPPVSPQYGMLNPDTSLETSIWKTNTVFKVTQNISEDDRMKSPILNLTPVALPLRETSFIDELHHIGEDPQSSENSYPYITPPQTEGLSVQPKDLYTLFNCGFKSLLTGSHHQKWNQNEGLQSLSQTVPEVFSPGYRDAMNHRARLIPSLAMSIASALKYWHNPSLHSKILNLGGSHRSSLESLSPTQRSAEQRTLIQASLWRIAQKQLFNPNSSKRLSPLDTSPTSESAAQPLQDILFCETPSEESPDADEHYKADWDGFSSQLISDEELDFQEIEDEISIIDFDDDALERPDSTEIYPRIPEEVYYTQQSIDSSQRFVQNSPPSFASDGLQDILEDILD